MENPLSWNETQKLIDRHLYAGRPEECAHLVTTALLDAGLIEKESAELVKNTIIEQIDFLESEEMKMVCGYSHTTSVYMKLAELKLLKIPAEKNNGQ